MSILEKEYDVLIAEVKFWLNQIAFQLKLKQDNFFEMKYNLLFNISVEKSKELYNVLVSEKPVLNARASYEVSLVKEGISFKVVAEDATSLRAILNAITTRLQIFEKSLEIE